MPEKVIIIGSGPAGYTAALYTARAGLEPLMFAGPQPGGQLMITTDVENYPGFSEGIAGPQMMEIFREQAVRFGTRVEFSTVTKVDLTTSPKQVWVDDTRYEADAVIISTGATAKWLGVPGEEHFGGYGVSACATCDGFFFRGKHVIVVGGGDTAMEEANYLTRHAEKVTLIHRREEFRASKIMLERAQKNPKIEFLMNTAISEILGSEEPRKVQKVLLRSTVEDKTWETPIDGVFVAIGHHPNSAIFEDQLPKDPNGYLEVVAGSSKTSIPGVFVAGDVADSVYRQAVTAAGTGCMAAIDAERWLEEQGE